MKGMNKFESRKELWQKMREKLNPNYDRSKEEKSEAMIFGIENESFALDFYQLAFSSNVISDSNKLYYHKKYKWIRLLLISNYSHFLSSLFLKRNS